MFDIGFTEILLLSLVGLLVLGPERLPRIARTLGGLARKARSSWTSLKYSIESEMREADMKKPFDDLKDDFKSAVDEVKSSVDVGDTVKDVKSTVDDLKSFNPLAPEAGTSSPPEKTADEPDKPAES